MREIHKEKLLRLNQDALLFEAIKIVFYERIEKELPGIENDNNSVLGEKFRAYIKAKEILYEVFKDIASYEDKKIENNNFNKGK